MCMISTAVLMLSGLGPDLVKEPMWLRVGNFKGRPKLLCVFLVRGGGELISGKATLIGKYKMCL